MPIIALLCLLFGVAAALLLVLYVLQRRQLGALEFVARQVQLSATGGSATSRPIELQTDLPELGALVTAVNHLLARAGAASQRPPPQSLIGTLGDRRFCWHRICASSASSPCLIFWACATRAT